MPHRLSHSLIVGGIVAVALTQIASAADLPRKAPAYQPPPPPVLSWAGWYVGLNAGWGWGHNDGIENSVVSTFCDPTINSCNPNSLTNAMSAAVPLKFDTSPDGFIGGGQIGYNFQMTPGWLVGVEADFQGADIHGDASATNTTNVAGFATTVTIAGTASQKLNFLGTLRGRLGWTPTAPLLLYVTGGLAYGHVETNVSFSEHLTACVCGPDPFSSVSNDEWRAGWTVGGGLEWMFAPHWSVKGEYLYYDLGHQTLDSALSQVVSDIKHANIGISSEATFKGSIARVGVNYHF